MNLLEKDSTKLQSLFSNKVLVNEGEVSSKNLTPSKLYCPVYEVFRLQGVPMMGEEESFETKGYKESGNSRHQAIQKFLIDHPEVEWVDPGEYVRSHNLPFEVKPNWVVQKFMEKHRDFTVNEAKEIFGDYEVNLVHKTQPLSFKLDGLIKYQGEYYILEIKTVSKLDLKDSPLEKHQWQGKAYSFLLNIPKVCWVYESREDFKIKVSIQFFRPEEHNEVRARLNSIILNRDNPKNLQRNLKKCKFCRYFSHCSEIFLSKTENSPF